VRAALALELCVPAELVEQFDLLLRRPGRALEVWPDGSAAEQLVTVLPPRSRLVRLACGLCPPVARWRCCCCLRRTRRSIPTLELHRLRERRDTPGATDSAGAAAGPPSRAAALDAYLESEQCLERYVRGELPLSESASVEVGAMALYLLTGARDHAVHTGSRWREAIASLLPPECRGRGSAPLAREAELEAGGLAAEASRASVRDSFLRDVEARHAALRADTMRGAAGGAAGPWDAHAARLHLLALVEGSLPRIVMPALTDPPDDQTFELSRCELFSGLRRGRATFAVAFGARGLLLLRHQPAASGAAQPERAAPARAAVGDPVSAAEVSGGIGGLVAEVSAWWDDVLPSSCAEGGLLRLSLRLPAAAADALGAKPPRQARRGVGHTGGGGGGEATASPAVAELVFRAARPGLIACALHARRAQYLYGPAADATPCRI